MDRINFYYGAQNQYEDVTDVVKKRCCMDNIIGIHKNDYKNLFCNYSAGDHKHLKVNIPYQHIGPVYIKNETSFTLNLNHFNTMPPIHIVYFINTFISPYYENLMRTHLEELIATGLCKYGTLYVEACGSDFAKIKKIVYSVLPTARVTCHSENNHEYFGIRKVWQLAQKNAGVVLYFHSKGISKLHLTPRNPYESRYLFPLVIKQWRRNISLMMMFESINKLGISAGGLGWIWMNYMWAKCSYLRKVERPIITERRHYYEDWISRKLSNIAPNDTPGYDCFSLVYSVKNNLYHIGSTSSPKELFSILKKRKNVDKVRYWYKN
ncbi:hypothetical protein IC620_01285 [Hazenella sp. IB182357]|uniref:Uncharacterized protein n=1 Tax=Polycladospora coralii TaxID=2771432 RepID=A0A926RW14_9BACL|nr:hypothetical protein [Polycladospora coralii]MBD1370996.1 hypothetical protein [Polycladospora coralii]MBS7529935.1 hypothetical protein [Polycladospora coralii]